ncbi:MAG: TetR/AcrR family transcriptional regulator [Proteobacteria bacterium]|nr:TetR/AcrR family transcriptional regulator [Pseudomonadota bacterium]
MEEPRASPTLRRRGRPCVYGERRFEVLRVAARVFGESGYGHATMDDVAAALGFTRPALYYYAKSKDALLIQCSEIAMVALRGAAAGALNETIGRDQLCIFLHRYCEICADDFGRCFILADLRQLDDPARKAIGGARLWLAQSVAAMIRRGIADGSLRDCDAELTSGMLLATFNGVVCLRSMPAGEDQELADAVLDVFFEGLAPRTLASRARTRPACRSNKVESQGA